jgi:hypothetical protein
MEFMSPEGPEGFLFLSQILSYGKNTSSLDLSIIIIIIIIVIYHRSYFVVPT